MIKGYENEYIKDFGMGYIKGDPLDRVVGIMLADLYKLSNKQQGFIEYFEYKIKKIVIFILII